MYQQLHWTVHMIVKGTLIFVGTTVRNRFTRSLMSHGVKLIPKDFWLPVSSSAGKDSQMFNLTEFAIWEISIPPFLRPNQILTQTFQLTQEIAWKWCTHPLTFPLKSWYTEYGPNSLQEKKSVVRNVHFAGFPILYSTLTNETKNIKEAQGTVLLVTTNCLAYWCWY